MTTIDLRRHTRTTAPYDPYDPDEDEDQEEDADLDRHESMDDDCLFPGECCMPGFHQPSECHTPDMLGQYYKEILPCN